MLKEIPALGKIVNVLVHEILHLHLQLRLNDRYLIKMGTLRERGSILAYIRATMTVKCCKIAQALGRHTYSTVALLTTEYQISHKVIFRVETGDQSSFYTVNRKNGNTFDIITLEKHARFL